MQAFRLSMPGFLVNQIHPMVSMPSGRMGSVVLRSYAQTVSNTLGTWMPRAEEADIPQLLSVLPQEVGQVGGNCTTFWLCWLGVPRSTSSSTQVKGKDWRCGGNSFSGTSPVIEADLLLNLLGFFLKILAGDWNGMSWTWVVRLQENIWRRGLGCD